MLTSLNRRLAAGFEGPRIPLRSFLSVSDKDFFISSGLKLITRFDIVQNCSDLASKLGLAEGDGFGLKFNHV